MRPRAGSGKYDSFFVYCINKQPVGFDMTLAEAFIISGQIMVAILFRERLFGTKFLQDLVQLR